MPCSPFHLGCARVSTMTLNAPSFGWVEAGGDILRGCRVMIFARFAFDPAEVIKEKVPARTAAVFRQDGDLFGRAMNDPILGPAPMTGPPGKVDQDIRPLIIQHAKTFLKGLAGLIRITEQRSISRWFPDPQPDRRNLRRPGQRQQRGDIIAPVREIKLQPSSPLTGMRRFPGALKPPLGSGKFRSVGKLPASFLPGDIKIFDKSHFRALPCGNKGEREHQPAGAYLTGNHMRTKHRKRVTIQTISGGIPEALRMGTLILGRAGAPPPGGWQARSGN